MTSAPALLDDDGEASVATAIMMSHHGLRRDLARFAVALERLEDGIFYHRICNDKSAATFKGLLQDYRGWGSPRSASCIGSCAVIVGSMQAPATVWRLQPRT